ncbi:MAG TPA: zf-HC2 domain-containing protein [Terriglobia bacterium]|nr:zf-HC2 domain-containing protein [Terriglobia bacterium]
MNCPTDEILRAKLDGELNAAEAQEADTHLAACAGCRERALNIARQADEVRGMISALVPPPGGTLSDPGIAFARFKARERSSRQAAPPLLRRLFAERLRPAWGAAALAATIVILVSFAPARTWAQKFLAMFRVEKITVVPVDLNTLRGPNGDTTAGKMLGQMIADNVVVTIHGASQAVATQDEASQKAGYKVRLLSTRTDPPQLTVEGEQAFHMTINRERAQSVLDEAGRSDLILPASLDGATIAVQIPAAVVARYGHCPIEKPKSSGGGPAAASAQNADISDCLVVAQVPSPTVSVPPNLNLGQIVELGLQAGGMSAQQAHDFCQTVDWTSTLVLPLPRFVNSYQTVTVDGVDGTLIDLPRLGSRRPAGYTLMWVKGGFIYTLMGFGDSSNAVALAETLN